MKFETLKAGDYIECEFTTINGGGMKKYFALTARVVYVNKEPDFAVIIDNEDNPFLILRDRMKKIKQAKVL